MAGEGGGIVTMSDLRDAARFQPIAELRAYWEGLRGGRAIPLRADVDPRGIERVLEHAFILERIAPQIARFRLAGLHLTDLMGMEVRGMPVTSFFLPEARASAAEGIERAFQGPAAVEFALEAETGFGKPALDARMIVLPLRSDLGDVSRALGCLVAFGAIGRTPRRFTVKSACIRPIVAGRPVAQSEDARENASGFAEPAAAFAARPALQRSRAHLRLVKSDE